MGRVLLALLCAMVVWMPVQAQTEWPTLVKILEQSVMQISATCSAFAIDDEKDYALTAGHCKEPDSTKQTIVDLVPSRVVAEDVQRDFLILHVPGMDKKPLRLAKDDPDTGQQVASWGFGYGFISPMLRVAYVSNRRVTIPGLDGEWVIFDGPFVGGQSGSPIINSAGEVVALVQMTSDRMGIGRGARIIRDRVGRYFPKTP